MSGQFLFAVNQDRFDKEQILLAKFSEIYYNGSAWIYLIHNRATKHKVSLKKVKRSGLLMMHGATWKDFVRDSKYMNVSTLHFIREEENTYYVTAYDNDGSECGGYNLTEVGNRIVRCVVKLGDDLGQSPFLPDGFLQNIHSNEIGVRISGRLVSTVMHRREPIPGTDSKKKYGHQFYGKGWNIVVADERLEAGVTIVFTKNAGNFVALMQFSKIKGIGFGNENLGRTYLNKNYPFKRNPFEKDPRMFHICDWEGHTEHFNEKRCFHRPLLAYVTDRGRLTIPFDFVKANQMWKYHNALIRHEGLQFKVDVDLEYHKDRPYSKNHVNMYGKWRNIVRQCYFEDSKLARFKLVNFVEDTDETVDPSNSVMMPVFDMC